MRGLLLTGTLLCGVLHVLRAWASVPTAVDDAFISARYARHAAEGYGLVYNAGEPAVEGFTNLLWTLWLVPPHWLGLDVHDWMTFSGLGFGVVGIVCAIGLTRSLCAPNSLWPLLPGLLLSLDVHYAVAVTNGLETAMFVAGVLGAAWAAVAASGSARWGAGLLVGLLAAIRPEGFVFGGLLMLGDLWTGRGRALGERAAIAAPVLALWATLELWRVWTYGAWVPNTVAAKAVGGLGTYIAGNLRYFGWDWPYWATLGLLLILATVAARRRTEEAVLAAGAWAMFGVAMRVYIWMPAGRLLLPAIAVTLVLLGVLADRSRWARVLAGLVVAAGVVAPSTFVERWNRSYDRHHSVLPDNQAAVAARHLERRAPPGSWLATRDAGVVAYYVGTSVRVAELHERALTQPHRDGGPARLETFLPEDPAFIIATQRRPEAPGFAYGRDRRVLEATTVPYRYLGRVYQHYHRFYDFYARGDVQPQTLPRATVIGRPGAPAPRTPQPGAPP